MIVALLVHEACNEDEQFFVFMADWLPQVYQLWSIKTSFGLADQVLLNNCVRPPFEEMSLGESGHRSKRFHLGMAHSWSPKLNGYRKWVCLKMVSTPKPTGFADHYPYEKWLAIIGNINPRFSGPNTID